ncbi:RnfABCDGE type electron transport complex subunit D [Salinibius halmophilus]|uniref:RnfABCDGE type electron transport complex subunit D n=1 Tax=Salinibius halmophilus TaxID=1853216 RepID=UPI000E669638|nr:RnfABCDGE type electron transport complex subunit D [Salinibius halmophilus]
MPLITLSSPHSAKPTKISTVMGTVLLCMIPGFIALTVFFSYGYLINLALAVVTALLLEAGSLALRKRPIKFFITDLSVVVTAALLAASLPPFAPWWITVVGTATAVLFGKHIFGGMGQNPFNPAMLAYALLLVSFPVQMTTNWPVVDVYVSIGDTLRAIFAGNVVDGWVGATPLDYYKLNLATQTADEILASSLFNGWLPAGWVWVSLAWLAGGLVLIWRRIITWHLPVSMIATLALLSLVFGIDSDSFTPASIHLLAGATMLGAFFIITDPVSCATSNRGKLVFGAGVGVLTYVIRTWGNYPDAIAFATLLMNFAAPFIDHYTKPRTYGHTKAHKGHK